MILLTLAQPFAALMLYAEKAAREYEEARKALHRSIENAEEQKKRALSAQLESAKIRQGRR